MRVISGTARGRKLVSPEGNQVRPTLDRVKEAVFNMLAFSVQDASVLDLFAGSGGLGVEALSRGAARAVFVDASEASLRVVRENLALTRLEEKAACVCSDFLTYLSGQRESFDLIFLDPPYAGGYLEPALLKIREKRLLAQNGLVVCELDSAENPDCPEGYVLIRNKKYGKARILLMKEL